MLFDITRNNYIIHSNSIRSSGTFVRASNLTRNTILFHPIPYEILETLKSCVPTVYLYHLYIYKINIYVDINALMNGYTLTSKSSVNQTEVGRYDLTRIKIMYEY